MMVTQWTLLLLVSCIACCAASEALACGGHMCSPSTRATQPPASTSEEDIIKEARCFAICVDALPSYCNRGENYTVPAKLMSGWSVLTNKETLTNDCKVYQKFSDCKRGCLIKANNHNLANEECKDQCTNFCLQCGADDCSSHQYNETTCNIKCRGPICRRGCELHNSPAATSTEAAHSSVNLNLHLVKSEHGGQYNTRFTAAIDISDVASGDNIENISKPSHFISFIIKVETRNKTYFIWQFTAEDKLDLEFATCEMVNTSHAIVNTHGIGNYSPLLSQCVTGGYPEQILGRDITFTYSEDFRFSGRALVNITWPRPKGYEAIDRYLLELHSQTEECGGAFTVTWLAISGVATSYLLKADNADSPPVFKCRYLITITAEPKRSDQLPARTIMTPEWPTTHADLHCGRDFLPNGKITIFATLSLSNIPGLIEAIENFYITPSLVDISNQPAPPIQSYSSFNVNPDKNNTIYLIYVENLQPQTDPGLSYQIEVDTVKNHDFPWRRVPSSVRCYVNAQSEPPYPINASTITINHLVFTDTLLNLTYQWLPPNIPNGQIEQYQSRISAESLLPQEANEPMHLAYLKNVLLVDYTNDTIVTDRIYQIEQMSCLYLQMRSYNGFFWSNWSYPKVLSKYHELDPHCLGLPTTEISTPVLSNTILLRSSSSPINVSPPESLSPPSFVYGVVALCAVMVLIMCFLCPFLLVLWRRYRRRNRYLATFKDPNDDPMYTKGDRTERLKLHLFDAPMLDEWEIPACDVIINDRLGEGCFGEVYKGMIKGPINNPKVPVSLKNVICPTVAIKLLKPSASGIERKDFLQEIDTLKKVSEGNNPHVVNLMGCVTIQEPLCLITEFIKHGNLLSYLHNIRDLVSQRPSVQVPVGNQEDIAEKCGGVENAKRCSLIPSPENPYADLGGVEAVNLLSFAYQIASGMEYLSSLGIIHRDLACRNILVGEGKSLKISDFGMSRLLSTDDIYVKSSRGRQPWKWMAIESIMDREFTTASDVWAYGIVLWEIATLGGFPYPTISNCELLDHLKNGFRLEKPDNCSSEVYEIMFQCWDETPKERPSFSILRAKFDSLITTQQDHMPYIDLDIDAVNPYYLNIPTNQDEDKASLLESNGASDLQKEGGYDSIRPLLESAHEMPRQISNAYVETPTGLLTVTFPTMNDSYSFESGTDMSLSSIEQPASSSLVDPV